MKMCAYLSRSCGAKEAQRDGVDAKKVRAVFLKHDSVLFNGVFESVHTRWRSCGPKQTKGSTLQATNKSADDWKAIADSLKGQVWDFQSESAPLPIAGGASGNGGAPAPLPLDGPPSEALFPGLHHGSFFRNVCLRACLRCVLEINYVVEKCVLEHVVEMS